MKIPISAELRTVFENILNEKRSEAQWAEVESDDMFQSSNLSGGFDATENAFCFSIWLQEGKEYWFQKSLDEIHQLICTKEQEIEVRSAD